MDLKVLFQKVLSERFSRRFLVGVRFTFLLITCSLLVNCSQPTEEHEGEQTPMAKAKPVAEKTDRKKTNHLQETATQGQLVITIQDVPESPHDELEDGSRVIESILNEAEYALLMDLPEDEKLSAIKMLDTVDHPVVISLVMTALDDPNSKVRKTALEALADVDDETVNDAFLKAMKDDDLDVSEKVMTVMDGFDSPIILPSLEAAFCYGDRDMREKSLSTIEDISDPRAIEMLIEKGLLHDDEEIRSEVYDSLEYITSERFESYEDAREWWDYNQYNFEFDG